MAPFRHLCLALLLLSGTSCEEKDEIAKLECVCESRHPRPSTHVSRTQHHNHQLLSLLARWLFLICLAYIRTLTGFLIGATICVAFVPIAPFTKSCVVASTRHVQVDGPRQTDSPTRHSSLSLPVATGAGDPAVLVWTIRALSAVASYVGFIGYFDRPRGPLAVSPDAQVQIQTSTVPDAGLGLFARVNLPKGTVLGQYPGVVIPLSQNLAKLREHPACEAYIWRFSDNAFVIDPTNAEGKVDETCTGGRIGLPGSQWLFDNVFDNVFDMSVPTALCRINEPPLGFDVNVVTDEDLQNRSVLFTLERDVAAGEEFFIDYGLSYDRSMYGKTHDE